MYAPEYPEFSTVTCLNWNRVLENDKEKEIIIESMRFLVREKRVTIFGFVLMSNHFHFLWQMMAHHNRENEQRNFLKFTAQQILKSLRNDKSEVLRELFVEARDRKYQVWERNSLNIPLWSQRVTDQKLEYIHMNPVRAGLCEYPEDYKYSSARFYLLNERTWDFLTHIDD
jgi:putative transposase